MTGLRRWIAAARAYFNADSRRHAAMETGTFRAKFDEEAFALLADSLRKSQAWPARPTPRHDIARSEAGAIWSTIPRGHKWIDYFEIYDAELSRWRGQAPKVLEIGIYKGASLKLWKTYFGPEAMIVGIDIDRDCARYAEPDQNIHCRIGSQADPAFLAQVIAEFGPFDLILDDGSHVSSHQIASFNALFLTGLKQGGLYLIEDLEAVYWGHATGQLDQPVSAMDFLKMLVDVQHSVFTDHRYPEFLLNSGEVKASYDAPALAAHLHSVKFFRGMCFISKRPVSPPVALHN